jgi:hypothetical protein
MEPAHVFVFVAFPVLSIYASSLATFPLGVHVLLRPLLVACGTTALALVLLRLWTSHLQQRAVALSFFLIGVQSIVFTLTVADGYWLRTGKPAWALVALHLVGGLLLAGRALDRERAQRAAPGLQIAACALLLAILGQIILVSMRHPQWQPAVGEISTAGRLDIPAGGPRPDIVHVLLDGLGSPRVLQTYYGLDPDPLLAALESAHFAVGNGIRSNYPYTYSSVASLLNASYLDPLARFADTADRRPLRHLLDHASVITALKSAGYRFTLIGSSYSATDRHPLADRCDCAAIGLNELETAAYRFSPLRLFDVDWLTYKPFRRKILYELDAIRQIDQSGPPQFVLAHLIIPHPPFAFDAAGRLPPGPRPLFGMPDGSEFPGTAADYRLGYRGQAQFALEQVKQLVDFLQTRVRPTVIIVSGDHGPGAHFDRHDAAQTDLRERYNTFLAVRVPGRRMTLPAGMTLVNLYRQVLRQALNVSVDDLADRTIFTGFSTPYRFEEVTVPIW